MTNGETALDAFLLENWSEAAALRDAFSELEDRMTERLTRVVEGLKPWCHSSGLTYVECDAKYAGVNVAKASWMSNDVSPRVYYLIGGMFPSGFRKVVDPHPSIWVWTYGMSGPEQNAFRERLAERLAAKPDAWINEECTKRGPAGIYIRSHGDAERVLLAQSDERLEQFLKAQIEKAMSIAGDIDAAL